MRKPNGYGSIKHLSGNRRRPFVFVVSRSGKQVPVEYFVTQLEAEIYVADYNRLHGHHSLPAITGQESDILSGVPYFGRLATGNTLQDENGSTCQIYWIALGR